MINIEIDRLTNSIVNAISGDVFDTEVLPITAKDLKTITKAKGWKFDWKKQAKEGNIYKLVIAGNPTIIQGLVCFNDNSDHIYLSLIENAPFNFGAKKLYLGVAGNLFAYSCKVSFEQGYEGFVAFHAKTELMEHYTTMLGAKRMGNSLLMFIETKAAMNLVKKYFKP
jgi:hypothetical protein